MTVLDDYDIEQAGRSYTVSLPSCALFSERPTVLRMYGVFYRRTIRFLADDGFRTSYHTNE